MSDTMNIENAERAFLGREATARLIESLKDSLLDKLSYNEQELTVEQQEQARKNIGVVQSDYAQNDTTAQDYIKNRICYEEVTETAILEETTIPFNNIGQYVTDASIFILEGGNSYTVTIDDKSYVSTATTLDADVVIGNLAIVSSEPDTGEPFLFVYVKETDSSGNISYYNIMVAYDEEGSPETFTPLTGDHTVSIIGTTTVVHKIDPKFLPDAGLQEVPQATADTLGGVKAAVATEADTQPVRIGADGQLFTAPATVNETELINMLEEVLV